MVGFYHAVDDLFVGNQYKGVLQRAHIMRIETTTLRRTLLNGSNLQLGFKLDSSLGIQGPKVMVLR
jgi:hypothetical protein